MTFLLLLDLLPRFEYHLTNQQIQVTGCGEFSQTNWPPFELVRSWIDGPICFGRFWRLSRRKPIDNTFKRTTWNCSSRLEGTRL